MPTAALPTPWGARQYWTDVVQFAANKFRIRDASWAFTIAVVILLLLVWWKPCGGLAVWVKMLLSIVSLCLASLAAWVAYRRWDD